MAKRKEKDPEDMTDREFLEFLDVAGEMYKPGWIEKIIATRTLRLLIELKEALLRSPGEKQ